jgi:formylglycine-generating enzyme required for sulfatase activity
MMGADDVGPGARPRHQVTIKTFQMTKTLVTFGQYKKCVAAGACRAAHVSDGACNVWNGVDWVLGNLPASFQGDDLPAVCVNWDEAQAFAEWAGGRLPTEAEWEYAARSGGRDQKYPWGDEAPSCDLTVFSSDGTACGKNSTWPVCSKPKGNTKQGLCDMDSGDVWELVQDWYHDSYNGAPTDGSAWLSPPGPFRVLRGGSRLISLADYLRATYRSQGIPGSRFDLNGFRLARSSR